MYSKNLGTTGCTECFKSTGNHIVKMMMSLKNLGATGWIYRVFQNSGNYDYNKAGKIEKRFVGISKLHER